MTDRRRRERTAALALAVYVAKMNNVTLGNAIPRGPIRDYVNGAQI